MRRCGLKYYSIPTFVVPKSVTSHAEVWIEIKLKGIDDLAEEVTSHAEVWIEMDFDEGLFIYVLKVTSHAEVWIEILVIIVIFSC